jgi:catechol 2,3-dioxygenase-like lactoylglutathione lyase family enzyme
MVNCLSTSPIDAGHQAALLKGDAMSIRFGHINIISRDWRRLSKFYQTVFACIPVPPVRNQSGPALEAGTGVQGAELEGEHLRLPGLGENGPTLEIYSFRKPLDRPQPAPNRMGLGHLAFQVPDVAESLAQVLEAGGSAQGTIVSIPVAGKGTVTFVYAADPEGNIIELQSWSDPA